jgi:hypothetical protein
MGQFPADEVEKFFLYSFIEIVAKVTGQGAPEHGQVRLLD